MGMVQTMSFKVGDRATVNENLDPQIPDELRNQMVGKSGTVLFALEGGEIGLKPDVTTWDYPGGHWWAVMDYELDKIDD